MSDLGSVADSCMTASTGLQSGGLQSNAHAFRAELDPNVHAMQKIYTDLDEANTILERFCNKHMLPPPLEAEAQLRVRKIRLKLNYMPSRSNPIMLDTFSTGREGEAVYLLVQWLYAIMSVALRYTTSKSCLLIHVYCKSTSCFSKSTLLTKRVFPEEVGITVPKRHGDGHLHYHHDDDSLAGHRATPEDAPSRFQRQQKRSSSAAGIIRTALQVHPGG